MTSIVPLNPASLPARAQQRLAEGKGISKNFSDGVSAPIDILSIRGKVFRERVNGEEIITPRPQYEYDVVILDGTPGLGKTYYVNPYVDGSMAPPDCWSLNGIKPDASIPEPQAPTCRGCKWNVFGSRVMTDRPGKQSKAKACADSRRVAVMPAYRIAPNDGSDPNPMLLRIPATSLVPLKAFTQELERMGVLVNAVVTRLGFDQNVTHPQLTFAVVAVLTDDQYSHVDYLLRPGSNGADYGDERVRRILEAPPPVDDIDPSEFAGHTIVNRNQAPPAQPAASVPAVAVWSPAAPAANTTGSIISLPDGRRYDMVNKKYLEPEPEPAPEVRPDSVIELPDGKLYDTVAKAYWEGPNVKAQPISERAKAPPPVSAPPGLAGAPQTAWKPAATPQGGPVPGPGWRPPQGNGPLIQGEVVQQAQAAKVEEPKPEPKKRRPAPPVEATGEVTQEAPASLDALLNGLSLDKK